MIQKNIQQTPGTYPRPSTTWKEILSYLYLGVCWICLRNDGVKEAFSYKYIALEVGPLSLGGWTTHLNNISQIGSSPQVGVKITNILNHHLVLGVRCKQSTQLIKSLNISSQGRILMKQGYTASVFFFFRRKPWPKSFARRRWAKQDHWLLLETSLCLGGELHRYNCTAVQLILHFFGGAQLLGGEFLQSHHTLLFWWSHLCTEIFSPSFSPHGNSKNQFSPRPAIRIAATVLRKYAWPILKKVGWFRTWGGRGKPLQKWQVFFRSPA